MECLVARKLDRDLIYGQGFRPGKCTWENVAAFAHSVYKKLQRKEQTVAVAIDLQDAYNRVQFKLLMDLLMQY